MSALAAIGVAQVAEVHMWKAALIAGISNVIVVVEALVRSYVRDGELTIEEVNAVFGKDK